MRKAVTDHWLPALGRFKPELIFVSTGFDAHSGDMAQLLLMTAITYESRCKSKRLPRNTHKIT
ncbi:hypothetical protein [Nitrosomonas sp.]|uniref:hypothetical protein n=1 Tax=Nitrosomonas sp. TaxID=42353 RepID=UPI0032EF3375